MRISSHVISTFPLIILTYAFTKSVQCVLGVSITLLVDTVHWLEFWHDNGLEFKLKKFFTFCNQGACNRFFLLLHSYELLILLFVLYRKAFFSLFWLGMILGLSLHLLLDYLNIFLVRHYKWYSFILFFFTFRLFYRFKREAIDRRIGPVGVASHAQTG